jgi:hypothetical protein
MSHINLEKLASAGYSQERSLGYVYTKLPAQENKGFFQVYSIKIRGTEYMTSEIHDEGNHIPGTTKEPLFFSMPLESKPPTTTSTVQQPGNLAETSTKKLFDILDVTVVPRHGCPALTVEIRIGNHTFAAKSLAAGKGLVYHGKKTIEMMDSVSPHRTGPNILVDANGNKGPYKSPDVLYDLVCSSKESSNRTVGTLQFSIPGCSMDLQYVCYVHNPTRQTPRRLQNELPLICHSLKTKNEDKGFGILKFPVDRPHSIQFGTKHFGQNHYVGEKKETTWNTHPFGAYKGEQILYEWELCVLGEVNHFGVWISDCSQWLRLQNKYMVLEGTNSYILTRDTAYSVTFYYTCNEATYGQLTNPNVFTQSEIKRFKNMWAGEGSIAPPGSGSRSSLSSFWMGSDGF